MRQDWICPAAKKFNDRLRKEKILLPNPRLPRKPKRDIKIFERRRFNNRAEDCEYYETPEYSEYPVAEFDIIGSEGNVYEVIIDETPTCTCPDAYFRKRICKHICSVFSYVYGQKEYPERMSHEKVLQVLNQAANIDLKGVRKPIEGACGICLDPLDNGKKLVWCQAECGNNWHSDCVKQLRDFFYNMAQRKEMTCPMCRAIWAEAKTLPTAENVTFVYPSGNDGYAKAVPKATAEKWNRERRAAPETNRNPVSEGGRRNASRVGDQNPQVSSTRTSTTASRATNTHRRNAPPVSTPLAIASGGADAAERVEGDVGVGHALTCGYISQMDISDGVLAVDEAVKILSRSAEPQRLTCEFKYDGFRVEIHFCADSGRKLVFSHGGEDITAAYPDVETRLDKWCKQEVKSYVLDCEMLAWEGERPRSRRDLSTRRKGEVLEEEICIQVRIFAFDLLFLNGLSLVDRSLRDRRQKLHDHFYNDANNFCFAKGTENHEHFQQFFKNSVREFREGVVIKKLDSIYRTGQRSTDWIKVKTHHSLDLVVIGATKQKNSPLYGSFLLACYNKEKNTFEAIAKVSNFPYETKVNLFEKFSPLAKDERDPNIVPPRQKPTHPEVWFTPEVVFQVQTEKFNPESPNYPAGQRTEGGKGISLETVKFEDTRPDKTATQATTSEHITQLCADTSLV